MRIYFVRHGDIVSPGEEKRYIGITDLPLTEAGVSRAKDLANQLVAQLNHGRTAIYCSPLQRCRLTAQLINQRIGCDTITVIPDLREINLGAWENLNVREVRETLHEQYEARGNDLLHYRTPGGETFEEAGNRFSEAIEKIIEESKNQGQENAVIVAHKGVVLAMMAKNKEMSINDALKIPFPYCGVLTIDI